MKPILRKNPGFTLPMVLIVLILGSVLIYVTYGMVTNLFTTSSNVVEDLELYNAALDGVERGKNWILNARTTYGRLPRWEASDPSGELSPSDLSGTGEDWYSILIVQDLANNPGNMAYSKGSIQVNVNIYDMNYVPSGVVSGDYQPGFPPKMLFSAGEAAMSQHMGSSYASSNRGEGSVGEDSGVTLGYYLIRSRATFEDQEQEIEQAVMIRL